MEFSIFDQQNIGLKHLRCFHRSWFRHIYLLTQHGKLEETYLPFIIVRVHALPFLPPHGVILFFNSFQPPERKAMAVGLITTCDLTSRL